MIELKNIKKDYNSGENCTHALRGINLKIEKGCFTAIIGASGSGKSTLLHIIGGMDIPTDGEYFFDGELVSAYSPNELQIFRKKYISFIFQNFALMDKYTVYENVEMPLIARKIKKQKRRERVLECLEKLNIAELKDRLPSQLSGGQQQRCAIARALSADTPIILADEPTGSLDSQNSTDVMNCFDEILTDKTIILITHDMNIAKRCQRIVQIEDGLIIQ